ncbi:MAG: hypothetical protein QGF59_01860, partial [Pirellulaceae bacterium]|nr:hypothetical protein [Pirellulaceae bacterium]
MRERQFNHRGPLASSLPARSSFRHLGTRSTAIMVFVCSALFVSTVSARKKFDESKLEFIDNGTIKLGVSPDLGGA